MTNLRPPRSYNHHAIQTNATHISVEPAFVLHSRPYQESSALLTLLTRNHGMATAMARGVRKARSKIAGLVTPFLPLVVTLRGKSELLSLQTIEAAGSAYALRGKALFYGLYLNELLLRLLHRYDSCGELYCCYQEALVKLSAAPVSDLTRQAALRIFEKQLLQEVGYGLDLQRTALGGAIEENSYYTFQVGVGFVIKINGASGGNCWRGSSLLALQREELNSSAEIADADNFLSRMLHHLLQEKFIACRKILHLIP